MYFEEFVPGTKVQIDSVVINKDEMIVKCRSAV